MKNQTIAVILGGGVGKRFWPLEDKTTFPFFGKPMVARLVQAIRSVGVDHIIVVTSPGNDSAVRRLRLEGVATIIQKTPGGMADAILTARGSIGKAPLLVVNVDDVFDEPLIDEILQKQKESGAFAVLPGWNTPQFQPLGYLALEGNTIKRIEEKPVKGSEPSKYIYFVCYTVGDSELFFSTLAATKSEKDDVHERALSALAQSQKILMHSYEGDFASLKYPWHVLDVMDIFLKTIKPHRGKGVVIKANVSFEGPVYLDDGVIIFENTKIVGPCYIGPHTIIGNNNIIRASHIGGGCVTGFNTDITRSYIGEGCWFHSNYIGDSVLAGDVSMGSGSVLANLRLDEGDIPSVIAGKKESTGRTKLGAMIGRGTRIGVNTSVMPGVKIGRQSFIGAGLILDRDIPEESFCVGKSTLTITKNTRRASGASRDGFRKLL